MRQGLTITHQTLSDLASEHGTPLFVYDGDSFRSRAISMREALSPDVEIHYSMKANPAIAVVALVHAQGLGVEIASAGELAAARAAGVDPGAIIFAGPGKADDEIHAAVASGVSQINAESILEIDRIARAASSIGLTQCVGVRVNPPSVGASGRIATSGDATKFGLDPEDLKRAIDRVGSHSELAFGGLHVMLASQVMSADAMLAHTQAAIELAQSTERSTRAPIPTLNFGGGIGVAHNREDTPFDSEAFASGLRAQIHAAREAGTLLQTRFVIEPGRALVSDAGVYVMRVLDVKPSPNGHTAVLDGGIHHAMLPITANSYTLERLTPNSQGPERREITLIGGPLCTSADQWAPSAQGLTLAPGDLVAMHNSGAYGLSAGMTMFLSRGTPPEVLVLDGEPHLIRSRSSHEDTLARQRVPASALETRGAKLNDA